MQTTIIYPPLGQHSDSFITIGGLHLFFVYAIVAVDLSQNEFVSGAVFLALARFCPLV
jgi:hypothetical protein